MVGTIVVNTCRRRKLNLECTVYDRNFTCIGTFLTIAYISKPTRNCHNKNQLRWDHVFYHMKIKLKK